MEKRYLNITINGEFPVKDSAYYYKKICDLKSDGYDVNSDKLVSEILLADGLMVNVIGSALELNHLKLLTVLKFIENVDDWTKC